MTLRSKVRDLRESFGNLSRRFKAKTSSIPGKSSDELQNGVVAIQQSSWASLPPEVLRDVLKRLKQDDSNWPSPKDVVACASVCTTWRDMCKYIVRNPEFCGKITLPVSLKQPGPRDGLIQCFIKRDKSKQTYHLYMSFSISAMLDDNGKFLLSAKRIRHMTYNGYTISTDSKNISQSGSGYIGMLRSDFFHRKFIIYDTQPPYNARTLCTHEQNCRRFSSRKVSPKSSTGNYPIAEVKYEYNVLGTRAPRQMQCTMHSIPTSAVEFGPQEGDGAVDKEEMLLVLRNKEPRWHIQQQCWCLNFHGRATVASVKNFQLIAAPTPAATGTAASAQPRPASPSSSSSNHDTVVLQFGRVSKDTFTMDYRYPLSAFQAFAICLTNFDTQVGHA
ncbi:hypothetical protein ACQ4PT_070038 [Festuca glaucescens]